MKNSKKSELNQANDATEMKKTRQRRKHSFSKPRFNRHMKTIVMNRFMRTMGDFLNQLDTTCTQTPVYNQVLNENIRHGFKGSYPRLKIDYRKVILSKGKLPNAPNLSVCSPAAGIMAFSWTNNSGIRKALPTDQLFVALYSRNTRQWIFKPNAENRASCYCEVNASLLRGRPVQVYAGFISKAGDRISTSQFLDQVLIL